MPFAKECLAYVLLQQSKFTEALASAEQAVALNPCSASASHQLGWAHFKLANYDQAEEELQRSFAPFNVNTLTAIGSIPWARGVALTKREDRDSELQKVIKTFDQAVDLANTDNDRGQLHYSLGRFHSDLKKYDSSRSTTRWPRH